MRVLFLNFSNPFFEGSDCLSVSVTANTETPRHIVLGRRVLGFINSPDSNGFTTYLAERFVDVRFRDYHFVT